MEINNTIKNICNQLLQLYKEKIVQNNASGNLSGTASYTCNFDGRHFEVYFILEEYWKYVEYGRKSGKFPPLNKIEEWIRIKPIVPSSKSRKIPSTKQLAFLISRSIAKNGTKAYKPLKETLDSADSLIEELSNEIINQIEETVYTYDF